MRSISLLLQLLFIAGSVFFTASQFDHETESASPSPMAPLPSHEVESIASASASSAPSPSLYTFVNLPEAGKTQTIYIVETQRRIFDAETRKTIETRWETEYLGSSRSEGEKLTTHGISLFFPAPISWTK